MSETTASRSIFISYRRDDAGGEAGRLFDDLTRAFDSNTVFMDVAGIDPGTDFRKAIDANVASAGVLLAVIGPTWLTIANSSGAHRLDDSSDFVRLEIASALARGIPVIPVLVHGASMPHADSLPDDLKDLAYRNAVELTLPRWNSDVALLVTALRSYVHVTASTAANTVHAAVPVQLPAPDSPATSSGASAKLRLPWIIGGSVAVALIGLAIYLLVPHNIATTQFQADLPFNAIGIASPGSTRYPSDGIDHQGNAFHAFVKMVDPATQTMKLANGDVFKIGPTDANDIVHPAPSQPTVLTLPAKRYTTLAVLATAANGPQQLQVFSVSYDNPGSSPQALSQTISDWLVRKSNRFPGESVVAVQAQYIGADGTELGGPVALYEYRFKLLSTLPVKSLTLPRNSNLSIIAVTLVP